VPTAALASEQHAASLRAFAEAGGTVLLGVRSGSKTLSNRFNDQPLPGPFRDLVGVTVGDWHSLPPNVGYDLSSIIPGLVGPATVWAEALRPATPEDPRVQVLAHYSSGPFGAYAALTERKVGSGRALYLGWHPGALQAEALLAHLASRAGLHSLADVPDGLIAARRGPHLILLNFTEEPQTATVRGKAVRVGPRDVTVVQTPGS
jgi:beta-galactosidase